MHKDHDFFMAPLLHHLSQMVVEPEKLYCGECDNDLELVPPELLYHVCRFCYPSSFDWKPYADPCNNR